MNGCGGRYSIEGCIDDMGMDVVLAVMVSVVMGVMKVLGGGPLAGMGIVDKLMVMIVWVKVVGVVVAVSKLVVAVSVVKVE